MCGRFTLTVSSDDIENYFNVTVPSVLLPRYNIAPSQDILVIRQNEEAKNECAFLRWGLIPSWTKADKLNQAGWINARLETAFEKPAFRHAFKQKHCIIVADGFYEWKALDSRQKLPFYFHKKDLTVFAFAGIWESWKNEEGHIIESCAILTKKANALLKPIHDRMPIILEDEDITPWLTKPYDLDSLEALLLNAETENFECYPVSTLVNKPSNDSPACIEKTNSL